MRSVDADALKDAIYRSTADGDKADWAVSVINDVPTVDAVEVVHCEECAYRRRCMLQHFVISNAVDSRKIDWSEWYCADGVRDDKATK